MLPNKPEWFYHQSAVIPYLEKNGMIQIMLITTRKKKKWTLPKGIVEPGLTPEESALQEAYEECGVEGEIEKKVFDTFHYEKWGGTCHVQVFLMKITYLHDQWPENAFRTRKAFSIDEAIRSIGRKEMQPVLKKFKSVYAR